ncbi:MAG: DUF6572 domain-containing protein [Bacteroidota bacterium]
MGLDALKVIDFAGIEKETGFVVLTIADSWEWDDEHQHLLALQEKINSYLEYVQTEQVWEHYPDAAGQPIVINLMTKHPLPRIGLEFLKLVSDTCATLGITIRTCHIQDHG